MGCLKKKNGIMICPSDLTHPSITRFTRSMNAIVRRCSIPLLQAVRSVSGFMPHRPPNTCQRFGMSSRRASNEASTPFWAFDNPTGCHAASSRPASTSRAISERTSGVSGNTEREAPQDSATLSASLSAAHASCAKTADTPSCTSVWNVVS